MIGALAVVLALPIAASAAPTTISPVPGLPPLTIPDIP
ncbi:L,D-transpeptidase, partial [Streptomyces sp. SID10244]|nr:L,D-transpeptidase [Streptomyces sp. SID10244]